jgi:hypothetical protein
MLKEPLEYWDEYEKNYPGFISSVVNCENAILPTCPYCGSWHTAQVTCGIVSRSIHLVAATTKYKIRLNPLPGKLYCNDCEGFFTPEDFEGPIWWHQLIDIDQEE